jgi:hypothetical protein
MGWTPCEISFLYVSNEFLLKFLQSLLQSIALKS